MDRRWNRRHEVRRIFSSPLSAIAALLLAAVLAHTRAVAAAPVVEFHIAAGDATLTLNEFGRQANLQLLFDFPTVKGRTTQAVDGYYEPRDALRHMLGSTGLTFTLVNERTLAVTPMRSASSASGSAAPAPKDHPPQQPKSQTLALGPGSAEPKTALLAEIETIRVTGTNVRGESPVGSNVMEFGRQAIDDTGMPTVADFLETLPQVFGGGPTQDTRMVGSEAPTNSGFGTGVNLRGLGARATLVLMNGRRIAPGGTEGAFVDVENIPLSAIERVEILPDSASALYGADAVGGVVNFITRDDFVGAETTLSSGTGSGNTLKNYLVSQTLGHKWDRTSGMISLEFYRRDALPASARSYAVSNLTPFGGSDFDTPLANPGNITVGTTTYAIPAGQNGTHLSPTALIPGTVNLADKYLDADILPEQRRWNLYASGRTTLFDRLDLFGNVLVGTREAQERTGGTPAQMLVSSRNPFYVNPAGGSGPVIVSYNFGNDLGSNLNDATVNTANATFGVDFNAGASWKLSAYAGYARETENQTQTGVLNSTALAAALADPDPATAFNPFGDDASNNPQTLSTLTTAYRYRGDSQLEMADVTADGPLWQLPGGALKLAVGLDRRDQFFASDTPASAIAPESRVRLSRQTTAGFAELIVPLFGKNNAQPALRQLEFSAAARYENYGDFGNVATPKFGLLWSPVASLALRSTWSKSVRPPSLIDLDESRNVAQPAPLIDPHSPSGQRLAVVWSGNNAQLIEERANSWTLGLDFTPERISGLSVGLTLYDIAFRNRIEDTLYSPNVLVDPRYSGLVTLNPDPAFANYVCSHTILIQLSQSSCALLASMGGIVDLRVHNTETLRTRGIDFNAKYEMRGRYGRFGFAVGGTYITKFDLAEGNGSPTVAVLNTQNSPINLRLRSSVTWAGRRLGYSTSINYSNSYQDTVSNAPIASWTTIDAQVRYKLGADDGGPLDNTQIELNAINLFDRDPPFLNNQAASIGYDQENADPYGRIISLMIRKNW